MESEAESAGLEAGLRQRLQSTLGAVYTLGRELGGGGMSRVFTAEDARLGRRVVVKVLHPDLAAGLSAARFEREVRLAARLQHPHVVPLLSAGDVDGLPYYTMPLVEGENLRQRLAREGALPIPDVVRLLRELADALAYAHGQGVVHRDLKPENVLLSGGHAVIADFGVAKAVAAATQGGSTGTAAGSHTAVGLAVGTPAYMAPEQAAADPATDHRADLYALGLIAYELLTGAHPFGARAPQAMVAAHLTESPAPLATRRADVPPALAALVTRLLAKDPAQRPASTGEVLRALDGLTAPIEGTGDRPPPAAPRARPRSRHGAALLVAGVAVLLTLAGWAAWSHYVRAPDPVGARTIAVLPFENLGSPADLYFADGITEEIASRLARVPGLTVLGRASALGLRGSGKSAEEVGRALGAVYVLRGSVRWARAGGGAGAGGATVRIVPALVNVESGAEVWGEPYQAPLTDVFRVQADVADRVAGALQTALGGATGRLPSRATLGSGDADKVVPAAYDAYLLGRSHWRKRGAPNLRRAAAEFQRAIAIDPGFARAWAGYADVVSVLRGYGDTTRTASEARREAEPAARRAIALDPADAHGYVALASVLQNDYDFRGALAALDEAIARDPSDATAHQRRAEVLLALGRGPEAEAAGRRALALDPLAAVANHVLATVLLTAGRDDEAIRLWRRAVALEPGVPLFRQVLGIAYIDMGRPDEAEAVAREAGDTSRVARAIRRGLGDSTHRREARAAVAAWRAAVPDRVTGYTLLAWWYARLGLRDSALVMLRHGAAEREPGLPALLDDRSLRGLRTDPRWAELVREVRGR